jgi:hypothetical protein
MERAIEGFVSRFTLKTLLPRKPHFGGAQANRMACPTQHFRNRVSARSAHSSVPLDLHRHDKVIFAAGKIM